MWYRRAAAALAIVAAIAGCGGLETTAVSYDRLMYGNLTTFTVTGVNLDKGVSLITSACPTPQQLTGGTATQQTFTCTVTSTGSVTISVIGGNVVLHKAEANIPVPQVTIKTSMGDLLLELDPVKAPITSLNFMRYVNNSYYNNLIFHRVIANFVIQGGGYDANMVGPNTLAPIKLESGNGLTNLRGTLAMARLGTPDSATSQFYVNVVDNPSLDKSDTNGDGYAVFGKVISGMDTVDAIAAVPTATTASGVADVPVTPVVMTSVTQTQ